MADLGTTVPGRTLNPGRSLFREISHCITAGYAGLRARFKKPSPPRIIDPPAMEVKFCEDAPVAESIAMFVGWLAQIAAEKPAISELRFVETLTPAELPPPLEGSPIPNPVKIQQLWWNQGDATQTSVLLLYARPEPMSPHDVAVVVCGRKYLRAMETLAEGYRRSHGFISFSEIVGEGGREKLIDMIRRHGLTQPYQPTAEEIMASRTPVPEIAVPPRAAAAQAQAPMANSSPKTPVL